MTPPVAPPQMVRSPVAAEPDLVTVDTTWGEIQPMEPARAIRAIGDLELLELATQGVPLVDGRMGDLFTRATIPGSVNIPFDQVVDRRAELDDGEQVVFFCNGPQCPQPPAGCTSRSPAG